jgi:hypothetical protein
MHLSGRQLVRRVEEYDEMRWRWSLAGTGVRFVVV